MKIKLSVLIAVLLVACNNPTTVERVVDLNKKVALDVTASNCSKYIDSLTSPYSTTSYMHGVDDSFTNSIIVPESTIVTAYYHDTTKVNPRYYTAQTVVVPDSLATWSFKKTGNVLASSLSYSINYRNCLRINSLCSTGCTHPIIILYVTRTSRP